MVFHHNNLMIGAAMALVAGLVAIEPASARPASFQAEGQLTAQVNLPQREGVPRINTLEVRGIITGLEGDLVQVRTVDGEVVSYEISEVRPSRVPKLVQSLSTNPKFFNS
ncbi:MAG: hypothetical protein Kow00121_33510 [Elainellaceae cyanobacterium]